MQKLWKNTGSAGVRGHPCTFLGCCPAMPGSNTSYLPQRPFFSEHSYHHAHRNHQAGEDSHEDAQDLSPGGEAVAAVLGGLVLDDVVRQQSLQDGKKARSAQSPLKVSCSKKSWRPPSRTRMVPGTGDASRVTSYKGRSCRDAGTTAALQHHPAPQAEQLPSLLPGTGPSSRL